MSTVLRVKVQEVGKTLFFRHYFRKVVQKDRPDATKVQISKDRHHLTGYPNSNLGILARFRRSSNPRLQFYV